MINEREEIRWKFQVMLENLEMVRDQFENERKFIDERYRRSVREIEKMRNYWFAGIGFFMTIFTAIIIAKELNDIYFVYPIGAGIVGFAIFFVTNLKLYAAHAVYREIDDFHFRVLTSVLIPLKGMISTYALIDNYSKDNVLLLVSYVTVLGKVVTYKLIQFIDEKLKLKQFKLEMFRKHYDLATLSLDNFKKANYAVGIEIIQEFIKDFQQKDKTKTRK